MYQTEDVGFQDVDFYQAERVALWDMLEPVYFGAILAQETKSKEMLASQSLNLL